MPGIFDIYFRSLCLIPRLRFNEKSLDPQGELHYYKEYPPDRNHIRMIAHSFEKT